MNNLRDAMLKAGLVSQDDLSKVEAQKKEDERLQEQNRRDSNTKNRLMMYALLGDLSRKMVESTHRTVRELICSRCGAEGSTRVDVMAVHAQMLQERKNFLFMIDPEEGRKFAQELKDRVGIIIDSIEYVFAGEERKGYLCIPCQQEIINSNKV